MEPGTLGGPASLEKSPRKDVCGGDQTCLSRREPQLPPCRSSERVDEAHFALLCTSEGFKWARFHRKRTEKYQRRKKIEIGTKGGALTPLSLTLIPMHVHKGVHLSRERGCAVFEAIGWGGGGAIIEAFAVASPGKGAASRGHCWV